MPKVLSGMQPSGNPHLGNYLGAMKQHIEMQKGNECFYFIADYHALTTTRDPKQMKKNTLHLALDYLALGIDPEKTAFFKQSDIPEVTELCWILNCITHMGLLERCHAWKDALTKQKKETSVGLFDYPVLMAADILIYQSDIVPVGKDQKQHVEIARDIAQKFNNTFGKTFKIPEPQIKKEVATIPGIDGEKMSKSYGNVIEIFAPEEKIKEQVIKIKTDSTPIEDPKDPEKCLVYHLYSLIATKDEKNKLAKKYKAGGFGYAEAKKMLADELLAYFKPYREKRFELEKNLSYLNNVMNKGAKKARKVAQETLQEVRKKIGLD